MTVSYLFNSDSKVVFHTFEGILNLEKMKEAVKTIWDEPEFDSSYDVLIDSRNIEQGLAQDEVRDFSDFIANSQEGFKSKLAILVSVPEIAASSSLYAEKTRSKHAVQIFTSLSSALNYIGASESDFAKLEANSTVLEY